MISWGYEPSLGVKIEGGEPFITPCMMVGLDYHPIFLDERYTVDLMFRTWWSDGTVVVGHIHPDGYYCVDQERSLEYTNEARTQIRLRTNSILNGMLETDY